MAINPDQIPQEKVVSPPPAVDTSNKTALKDSLGLDLNQLPGYLKQELKAKQEANKAKIESEQLETQARYTEKQKAIDEDVALTKQKYADVEKQLQPTPKFEPTQANALDIAGIFSLVATMGVALGGSGKLSSINALNSMGGMLKGYQQGRKDLFEKEQKTFDKELASIKANNEELIKGLERWNRLRAKDKEAAFVQGELLASQYPGVLAAKIRAGDTAATADIAHSLSTMNEKITELRSKVGLGGSGKGGGSRSAINERFQNTVIRSANETLRSLELMENIGIDIGKGGLGGVVGKGTIASEAIANLTRTMTSQDQLRYNAAAGGMALELAYVMNGGYKPNETQITELKNLYLATPQDSYETAAFRFADVVAKLKAALEVAPGYTDEQKQNNQMLLQKVNRYATPEEILAKINGEQPKPDPYVRSVEKPKPAQSDIDYYKQNKTPETKQKFMNRFGIDPDTLG